MGWNGSGTFNRIFSWVADKAAGLDISSTRMDTDTNDIAANGFGNCLTRDGQGQPTANLPMAAFRHIGVQNAVNRTDYAALGQLQDGLVDWTVAGGTPDALTATYTPAVTVLSDGQLCFVRATAANATSTPTFAPNGLTPRVMTTLGGGVLAPGSIQGAAMELILRYNLANTRWELLNPSIGPLAAQVTAGVPSTGDIKLTLKTAADTGWLLFDDGTFGSAASGSSNSNSALNQALFTLLFASPFTDATCPLLTSTGAGTTRAAQGSAAAAWAANCRMTLPKTLGRALAIAGSGSGLTTRALGAALGLETTVLTTAMLPPYTPAGTVSTPTITNPGGTVVATNGTLGNSTPAGGGSTLVPNSTASFSAASLVSSTPTFTGSAQGGTSAPFNIVQPSSFLNAMVKQ